MAVTGYATAETSLPEARALEALVRRCADSLTRRDELAAAVGQLRQLQWPRADFAAALFTVDLIRLGDEDARRWLPEHTPVLLAAWRNPEQAERMLAQDPELTARWEQLAPLLEAFDAPYLDAAVNACFQVRADELGLKVAVQSLSRFPGRRAEFALCLFNLELVRLGVAAAKAEFASRVGRLKEAYESPKVAEALTGKSVGLKALWEDVKPYLEEFFAQPSDDADVQDVIELSAQDLDVEDVAEEVSLEDIEPLEDQAPVLPPPPPGEEVPVPAEERAFWQRVERALLPPPGQPQISARLFDVSDREQRKRLAALAQAAAGQFPDVACAKAFGCLLQLYLAVQIKDKSLFGKPNPARKEALAQALSLLSGNAQAAARAAVFFVLDGKATVELLGQGLDQVYGFLGFCASKRLDPLSPEAVAAFLA